ncbi:MAG: hypothetical protein JWL80_447 [Parcubacteria group bacterium]|nr:hypothetical protein [Parcubacteria group bacterium]
MNKTVSLVIVVVILGALLLFFMKVKPAAAPVEPVPVATSTPVVTATSTPESIIKVTLPKDNAVISSPVSVEGTARGNWFFEGSAPVYVIDSRGLDLGEGHIQATGEWMTTDFVPFKGTITFRFPPRGSGTAGYLIFENDNPSGDPARKLTFKVPVTFK